MNTYSNAIHPEKQVDRTSRNHLFSNVTIIAVILTLVTAAAVAVYISNRPVAAAENDQAVAYSNALELQYARPWLEARNKPVVAYGNALEMQYAQPWLDKAGLPISCSSSMEMLYACKFGYGQP